MAIAMRYRGYPYVFGGASPRGFDCSGFVSYVFAESGLSIPREIHGQYENGPHPTRAELAPGDLVFFANTYMPGLSHVGIYVGDDQFIHAADENHGVTISNLSGDYWRAHWLGATRIRDLNP